MQFLATQIDGRTLQRAGCTELYLASNAGEAVQHLLYTRQLTDGTAKVSASGNAVHSQGYYWLISQWELVFDDRGYLLPQRHLDLDQIRTLDQATRQDDPAKGPYSGLTKQELQQSGTCEPDWF